ncbi:MAG: PadR family transcriptional regulator [Dehalococcoidia bacterium]
MSKANQFSQPDLPLTPPVFYILLSLSLKERHGYEILKHVQTASEGAIHLGPGTLYATLKRLLQAELVVEASERPELEHDDERRRYYRLTERGRSRLTVELARMQQALALAKGSNLALDSE